MTDQETDDQKELELLRIAVNNLGIALKEEEARSASKDEEIERLGWIIELNQ